MDIQTLKRCRAQRQEVASLRERIARLRAALEGAARPPLSGTPAAAGYGDRMAGQVAELLALEERLRERLLCLERGLREVDDWLGGLPPEEACVLRLRYVDGLPWSQVERQAGYSDAGHGKTAWTVQCRALGRGSGAAAPSIRRPMP